MRLKSIVLIGCMLASLSILSSCQSPNDRSSSSKIDAGGDAGADEDSGTDDDSGVDASTVDDGGFNYKPDTKGHPGPKGILTGRVMAPSGKFPISGALVYVTFFDGSDIPNELFCYECDDMTNKVWTLTDAEGRFELKDVPADTLNIVSRKGFFQRQREITVKADKSQEVPQEYTTLPKQNSTNGLDHIPSYAVLLNPADYIEDLLAKIGLADLDEYGHLEYGTEQFDLYDDLKTAKTSVGSSLGLVSSEDKMSDYHQIFFPCPCDKLKAWKYSDTLKNYVSLGGRVYASCIAFPWINQKFPKLDKDKDGNELPGPFDDVITYANTYSTYKTKGEILDKDVRDWLGAIDPSIDLDNVPINSAATVVDNIVDKVYPGHGLKENDGYVRPKVWVKDIETNVNKPMTITFNYDCGKVYYSPFHVVENAPSVDIRPQEWILTYLLFEVGVCEGEYIE